MGGLGRFANRPYVLMAFMMSAMACAAKRMPSMTMVKDAAPTTHRMSDGVNRDWQDVQDRRLVGVRGAWAVREPPLRGGATRARINRDWQDVQDWVMWTFMAPVDLL